MKKVVMTVVGVLAVAGSANAQGTWYTDQALWQSLVTNVRTVNYNAGTFGNPITENGVTATVTTGNFYVNGRLSNDQQAPVTFTFNGNAFSGEFAYNSGVFSGTNVAGSMDFSIDNSLINTYSLTTSTTGYTFLGYISDSSSPISVKVSGTPHAYVATDSFSFGQSVAPEPGTLALALTGGCALVGMYIRRRRMSN